MSRWYERELAERVHDFLEKYDFSICGQCSTVVADWERHVEWHSSLDGAE